MATMILTENSPLIALAVSSKALSWHLEVSLCDIWTFCLYVIHPHILLQLTSAMEPPEHLLAPLLVSTMAGKTQLLALESMTITLPETGAVHLRAASLVAMEEVVGGPTENTETL